MRKKIIFLFSFLFFSFHIAFPNELLKVANQLVEKEKYAQSEKLYLKILKDNKANQAVTYFNMANMYYRWGKMGNALIYYEKTIQKVPRFKGAYLNIGKIYFQYEKYKEALKIFLAYHRINPNDYLTVLLLADVYSVLDMKVDGEKYYNLAFEMKPNDFQAYYELSALYDDLGDTKVALRYLTEGLDLVENELPLLLYQARLYYEREEYNMANVIYDNILSGGYELSEEEIYRYQIQKANILLILGLVGSYFEILIDLLEKHPSKSRAKDLFYNVAIDNNELELFLKKMIELYPKNKIFYLDIRKVGLYAYQKQDVNLMQIIYDFYINKKIREDQIFLNIQRFLKT